MTPLLLKFNTFRFWVHSFVLLFGSSTILPLLWGMSTLPYSTYPFLLLIGANALMAYRRYRDIITGECNVKVI